MAWICLKIGPHKVQISVLSNHYKEYWKNKTFKGESQGMFKIFGKFASKSGEKISTKQVTELYNAMGHRIAAVIAAKAQHTNNVLYNVLY